MITIELIYNSGTFVLPTLAPPLGTETIEGATDIQTLDNNITTYFTANKRMWSHTWPFMSEDDYLELKAIYDSQWTLYRYPVLSITRLGIVNVPVRMYLDPRNVIDNCAAVENVGVKFRETTQLPAIGGV